MKLNVVVGQGVYIVTSSLHGTGATYEFAVVAEITEFGAIITKRENTKQIFLFNGKSHERPNCHIETDLAAVELAFIKGASTRQAIRAIRAITHSIGPSEDASKEGLEAWVSEIEILLAQAKTAVSKIP